ncbi:MAG: hypothetical protein HZA63_14090 [Rhodocyclales bacterium]|nr:hypothetical protein [Rhodocyclales bacterium]
MRATLTVLAALVSVVVCDPTLAAETGQPGINKSKLTLPDRHIFCGRAEEASRAYGIAVNAEITWRMAAGARTPAEALSAMRTEYCSTVARMEATK